MSTPLLAPTRRRGHLRVQAITDAAIVLFAERGFDGATMTEIAARSGTAIGSLYRFFPTKESLADRLLERYVAALEETFDGVAQSAFGLSPDDLAARLVATASRDDRHYAAMSVLADARRDGPFSRPIIRAAFHAALARVLDAWEPALGAERLDVAARLLRQLLKGAIALREEQDTELAARETLLPGWCALVATFLATLRPA